MMRPILKSKYHLF